MNSRPTFARLPFIAIMLALASCGGSDGNPPQDVATTEFSSADQLVLSGDWPLSATTQAFVVRSAGEWQLAWDARKATLNCEPIATYNAAACLSAAPPPVDFSRFALVGLLLHPAYYFASPNPRRVALDTDDNTLLVEYAYSNPYKAPFFYVTGTRFFLVPNTSAQLKAKATEV